MVLTLISKFTRENMLSQSQMDPNIASDGPKYSQQFDHIARNFRIICAIIFEGYYVYVVGIVFFQINQFLFEMSFTNV